MVNDAPKEAAEARRAPVQDRSIKRVNRILEVTANLVREEGLDGVKTTEIARRAGIKLASLYRYFPNKNAVLRSLVEFQFEKMRPKLDRFLDEFDLQHGIENIIDAYASFYQSEPGFIELWSGLQAIPELHQLDLEDLHYNADRISQKLEPLLPHMERRELHTIAMMVTRTAGAILRLTLTIDPEEAKPMIVELKTMVGKYLRQRLAP